MVLRSLKELLTHDSIMGFQEDDFEVSTVRRLIALTGIDKAEDLWTDGKSKIADRHLPVWQKDVPDEPLFFMVTNLTKPVEELSLVSIKPSSFSCPYYRYPVIIFEVE